MELSAQIRSLVEEYINPSEHFIVEIQIAGSAGRPKITIVLDGDQGIGIDTCALVSRKVGNQLEELDLISTAYTLEVTSPGIDQPLKLHRQYVKNTGRSIKIVRKDGTSLTGVLESVDAEGIWVAGEEKKASKKLPPPGPVRIGLDEVEKAYILVSFH